MIGLPGRALAVLLGACLGGAAFAQPGAAGSCPGEGAAILRNDGVVLGYRLDPPVPRVGEPFTVRACAQLLSAGPAADASAGASAVPGRPARRIRFDARMPQHGHGMNYRPSLTEAGEGWLRFDGSVLHMPGRWQLVFDVYDEATRHRLTTDVEIRR